MMLAALITTATLLGLYFLIRQAYNTGPMSTLYIIRGIPGSGKSTLAASMAAEKGIAHYEADMYFMLDGVYQFDRTELADAHMWCLDKARLHIMKGESVIISNTFTRWREMREYVDLATEFGLKVEIIHCLGDFGSIHDVPAETMDRMRVRFIPNEGLPQQQGIKYSTHLPVAEVANTVFG